MSTKRYSVDRKVGEIAVLVADDGGRLELPYDKYGLEVNDIVDITFADGRIVSVTINEEERDRRLSQNRKKFNSLFKKGN